MREDSPSDFVRFRPKPTPEQQHYGLALDLVGQIHALLEQADTRFHLKDQLDRGTTAIVMGLARVMTEVPRSRWQRYRRILTNATECATILDILERKTVVKDHAELARPQATLRTLISALGPLATGN